MKLEDMLTVSDKLGKGVEYEVFPNIVATLTTLDNNQLQISLNREIFKYLKENNIESAIDIEDEEFKKIQNKTIIKSVIKDVKGIQDDKGKDIEWSEDFGFKLMEDERSKVFFSRIFNYVTVLSAKESSLAVIDNETKKK